LAVQQDNADWNECSIVDVMERVNSVEGNMCL